VGADCARGGNVTVSGSIGHGSAFVLTRPAPADVRVALAAGGPARKPLIAGTEEESIRQ
jgi:hypothetical protein